MAHFPDIMERLLKYGLLCKAHNDSYSVNKIADPRTSHIKKEVVMQNVSPTGGTKNSNGNLIYMKIITVSYLWLLYERLQIVNERKEWETRGEPYETILHPHLKDFIEAAAEGCSYMEEQTQRLHVKRKWLET